MTDAADAAVDEAVARLPFLVRLTSGGLVVDVVPIDAVTVDPDGSRRLSGVGDRFGGTAEWRPVAVPPAADDASIARGWDVRLAVSLIAGEPIAAAADVAIRVPADGDPGWLVPALFYGENRPAESRARYPRWVETADPGDPFAATDWWFRADRAAIPAVLASGGGRQIVLSTTETSRIGMTGVGFGTVDGEKGLGRQREIRLSFPYREAPVVYDGSPEPLAADHPTFEWQPGHSVALSFRVYVTGSGDAGGGGPAERRRSAGGQAASPRPTSASSRETAAVIRSLREWLAPGLPLHRSIGVEAAASLAADGLLRWHARGGDGILIETAAFERGGDGSAREPDDRYAMHVAWLSGAPAAASLLAHGLRTGRADAIAVGRAVLDAISAHRAPCGTFWDQWTEERGWGKGWTPGPDSVHGRTVAEAALFLTRAAVTTRDAPRSWLEAVVANLDWIRDHERDGAVPTDWNARTGEPLSWAGTSALAWVPVAIEAAGPLGDEGLRELAGRIGAHHARDVEAGFLYGAPEDVDLGPTSEDGYVAIQAYVALARAELDAVAAARWLDLARRAADWTLTFRYAYNVTFPADSLLGRLDFRTRGADLASPANQHLHAYGLIVTDDLRELSAVTGDDQYRAQAAETLACFRQGIVREDGDLGGRRGMAPERYYQTRYDGAKGSIGRLSHAWCLGLLLHAAELGVAHPELVIDG
ncbi:MAG TPA: hypothetical protein VFP22_06705 [Candidatus Limnocylindrales bacterium]|nr:hypothetical protein [Candidatus Limnocylindrales bacterium]